ncbi:inositol polyphosphate 5-phosphatase [Arachnomyces sp. PD_36]|nr:inositol polyphosphate 5-phosphatase [Arachnomyces sp. PD_36]
MSLRVLCRDHPQRTIALATEEYVLSFQHIPSTDPLPTHPGAASAPPRCIVEFSSRSSAALKDYRPLGTCYGTLGLITLKGDVFLCVITRSSQVATVRPGETAQRIDSVEFYCLSSSNYDYELDYESASALDDHDFENRDLAAEHPFLALKKLLNDGSFYYSADFNLTNRLQDRADENTSFNIENLDESLLWNSYMIGPLLQFRSGLSDHERQALDVSSMLTSVIRGFIHTLTIPASTPLLQSAQSNLPSTLTVISRLSSRRAGTRFNSRGIDDDGNVANFVETETIFWSPIGVSFSYIQVRGSVPLFWEQPPGLIPGQQKVQITRSAEATQPAFDKHFEDLELNYGAVHVVNLLSVAKPAEAQLTEGYNYHISRNLLKNNKGQGTDSEHLLLRATEFDFHAETRGGAGYQSANLIRHKIDRYAEGFAYFLSEDSTRQRGATSREKYDARKSSVILQQEGVFRTNCLDSLDRTNLVQTLISRMALESFLEGQGGRAAEDFWMRHSTLWADNGDSLSKIYAGTGALKSSFTRHGKMSLAGAIADARKSATRLYVNNFTDKAKQNTIDLLLGRLVSQNPVLLYDPINDFVNMELGKRIKEYSKSKPIRIWAGTFNVNGQYQGSAEDLTPWLFPDSQWQQEDPTIVAVGFQEIVELSPQQIMSTDPGTRRAWEDAVKKTLNAATKRKGTGDYVLLRSGQLVGAALLMFVKEEALADIKNVEGSVKKTGLSGMGGNKGGCAIRLEYSNTRLCFVTAHLAAGFSNYDERNRDYETISHGLRFQKNRSIEDHDTIIWLGDFNYRIGLGNERVRNLVRQGDLGTLYENDQLNLQMVAGLTFQHYSESQISFLPTYRFNNGTDEYDTSEKARIPAWCDRILWKGRNLQQIEYNSAPIRFSDHRPVYATFECIINFINEKLKKDLSRELYDKRRKAANHSLLDLEAEDSEDYEEDLMGYESVAPGLPPASSERRKWWLDNASPAKSTIKPPSDHHAPNPNRTANPFSPSSEPDWVHVSRPSNSSSPAQAPTPAPVPPQPRKPMDINTSPTSRRNLPPPLIPQRTNTSPNLSSRPSSTTSPATTTSTSTATPGTTTTAPPIPRKPAKLTSHNAALPDPTASVNRSNTLPIRPNTNTNTNTSTHHRTPYKDSPTEHTHSHAHPPSLPTRQNTHDLSPQNPTKKAIPPPVQPRRKGVAQTQTRTQTQAHHQQSEPSHNSSAPPPRLPQRRETGDISSATSTNNNNNNNLLLDGGIEEDEMSMSMSSWEPLRPQR